MKFPRRQFLHLAASVAALPAMSRIARAQAYPTKPVRLILVHRFLGTDHLRWIHVIHDDLYRGL